jgi:hypothetical protein
MPSSKLRNVFKSRWNAVFWSASVLLTAYCSVPAAQDKVPAAQDKKTAAQDNKDAEKLLSHFVHRAPPKHHTDPWAK